MFRRSAHAQKLSRERNFAQLRNTYHSIRLDKLNQNLPSAHTLVEISTRYRRFTSAHAQLRNSKPVLRSSRIQMQLVETNLTTCVSSLGDASFQRYRRFRLRMRRFRNSQLPRMRSSKTKISRERSVAQRRDTPHSIRLDVLNLNHLPTPKRDWGRIGQLRMRSRKTTISRTDLNQSMRS